MRAKKGYIYTTEDIKARYRITTTELQQEIQKWDKIHGYLNGRNKFLFSREFYKKIGGKYKVQNIWK